jgi:hypothetical protein
VSRGHANFRPSPGRHRVSPRSLSLLTDMGCVCKNASGERVLLNYFRGPLIGLPDRPHIRPRGRNSSVHLQRCARPIAGVAISVDGLRGHPNSYTFSTFICDPTRGRERS